MKTVYCAKCGKALPVTRKGMPKHGVILHLVAPHRCGKTAEPKFEGSEETPTPVIDKPEYEFVQKLNKLEPPPLEQETGDRRDKKHLREEIATSSAPEGLIRNVKTMSPSEGEDQ